MSNSTDESHQIPVPTFREFAPEWAAASDRLKALCDRETELCAEVSRLDLVRTLTPLDAAARAGAKDVTVPPKPPTPLSKAARSLLGVLAPPERQREQADNQPKIIVNYLDPHEQRMADAAREIGALQEAIAALRPIHDAAWADGSKRFCETILPDYRRVAGDVCAALVALGDAMLNHQAFMRQMAEQGADPMWLRPLDYESLQHALGAPDERRTLLRQFLSWAIEGGHVPPDVTPDAWNPRPQVSARLPEQKKRKGILGRLADATRPEVAWDSAEIIQQ